MPFEFVGDPSTALAQYGQQVFNRINFIYPGEDLSCVSSERVCGGGRLSVGAVERPTSGGRSEPHECPQCDRLWRTFLGKCHRTVTELLAPAHVDILGKAALSAHHP